MQKRQTTETETDQCLPRTGKGVGTWRVIASGCGFSFWDDKNASGTSLLFQWLRLHAPTAGGLGSIPVRELRSHMLCGAAKKIK